MPQKAYGFGGAEMRGNIERFWPFYRSRANLLWNKDFWQHEISHLAVRARAKSLGKFEFFPLDIADAKCYTIVFFEN